MSDFNFQYSPVYLLLCLAIGLIFALFLYFKEKKFSEEKKWLPFVLGFIRFLAVSIISALLLVPMLKSIFEDTKNPIIVVAQDISTSMNLIDDDEYDIEQKLEAITTNLNADYQVDQYYFSNNLYNSIPDSVDKKSTNLENVFVNLDELYVNQNVGAIIIATDGIFNEGKNPLYLNSNISAPVFPIALGDTSRRKDVIIQRTLNNNIVFLGDKFSVQVDIVAQNCTGERTNLNLYEVEENGNRRNIKSIPIRIDKNNFFTTEEIILDANQSGVVRYIATLTSLSGEISRSNNRKDIFIEVLDARQKILLLANAPHPDISAFKNIIETNKNYEVTSALVTDNSYLAQNFDLIVLHNLPSNRNNLSSILSRPNLESAARLYVFGSQTNHSLFNQIQDVVTIEGNSKSLNETQGVIDNNFKLFNLSENIIREIPNYPPLLSPFGNYSVSPNAVSLVNQKIGKVETNYPLLVFNDQSGQKTGILSAEGLWKWRLFNFLQKGHYDEVTELINKSLQFLTLKEDKRKFRVSATQNIFKENDDIILTAELYNDSYERINEPEVNIVITDSQQNDFNFVFSKRVNYYYLNAGQFPPGNYSFKANVVYNNKRSEQSGRFNVETIQLEAYDLTARHGFLKSLAEKHNGQVITLNDVENLPNLIKGDQQIKPVVYASSRTSKLMDFKWVFYILLLLLSIEWFLRRFFGTY